MSLKNEVRSDIVLGLINSDIFKCDLSVQIIFGATFILKLSENKERE